MLNDKKIEEVAKQHAAGAFIPEYWQACYKEGFVDCAKWMQEEFLKDLWHPASEEPKKDMLVLTDTQSIMNKGNICWMTVKLTENGFIHNWSNYVKATKITRWLYIDDLLPKKGGDGK